MWTHEQQLERQAAINQHSASRPISDTNQSSSRSIFSQRVSNIPTPERIQYKKHNIRNPGVKAMGEKMEEIQQHQKEFEQAHKSLAEDVEKVLEKTKRKFVNIK